MTSVAVSTSESISFNSTRLFGKALGLSGVRYRMSIRVLELDVRYIHEQERREIVRYIY